MSPLLSMNIVLLYPLLLDGCVRALLNLCMHSATANGFLGCLYYDKHLWDHT